MALDELADATQDGGGIGLHGCNDLRFLRPPSRTAGAERGSAGARERGSAGVRVAGCRGNGGSIERR